MDRLVRDRRCRLIFDRSVTSGRSGNRLGDGLVDGMVFQTVV